MKTHYQLMLRDADNRIARSLELQNLSDPSSPYYGGFYDTNGLIEAKFAIYRVTTMITGYFNRDSRFFADEIIYSHALLGISFITRTQRENGFFDLNNCNFYSGPDTAFCMKRIIPVYCYLRNHEAENEKARHIADIFGDILHKGADAMLQGGFHTPNHRWAIASVLYFCTRLFNNDAYRLAADKYLAEGIDCNSDGEYAERSAGNYNRINNDAMIMLAIASGDDSYFEPVVRNLRMMLTYIEPDGSIFTNNSTRQDRGNKVYPKDYYMEYLYIGKRLGIPEFVEAANYIMELVSKKKLTYMDSVISFMNNPDLIDYEYSISKIPAVYNKHYLESNIVRARNDSYSYSIINKCPSFLYFVRGELTMGVKIGASFCEHRSFVSEQLIDAGDCYKLSQTMVGWYYLPFGEYQGTTDWWQMDNAGRKKLLGPNMIFDIDIKPVTDGLDLTIRLSGIDRAPLRVELSFDAGSRIETEDFCTEGIPGGAIVAKSGTLMVSKGVDAIEVGPCFGSHNFTAGKFGSDGRNSNCFTVYLTDHTCFEHTLHIRGRASKY